jgi:hypothetical protein
LEKIRLPFPHNFQHRQENYEKPDDVKQHVKIEKGKLDPVSCEFGAGSITKASIRTKWN